jgi:phage terminase small subunit
VRAAGILRTKNWSGFLMRKTAGKAAAAKPRPPIALNSRATALYGDVLSGWDLDAASREVLRLACEAVTRADEAAEIVSKEGQVFRDRWGQVRPHPAAMLERDHRQAASRMLQQLGVSLEGVS